jgi:hypothetical protein
MPRTTSALWQQLPSTSKSPVPAFYLNRVIETYAAKQSTPISLNSMINFGKYGRNKGEKEEAEKLLRGGNFVSFQSSVLVSFCLLLTEHAGRS